MPVGLAVYQAGSFTGRCASVGTYFEVEHHGEAIPATLRPAASNSPMRRVEQGRVMEGVVIGTLISTSGQSPVTADTRVQRRRAALHARHVEGAQRPARSPRR